MIEYVLICSVFGAASGLAAHSKARNALGWFATGFLLGPFGLVVAAMPLALKEGQTKNCSQCLEIIPQRALLCRFCRSPVHA